MDTWHQLSLGVNDSSPQYRVNDLEPQATYKFIMITTSSGGAMSEESSTVSATTLMLSELETRGSHLRSVCNLR